MSSKPAGKGDRRTHDEGNLRQRPDGRWEGRFYLPNGERASVYGKTKKEATAKLKDAKAKAKKGLSLKAERQPLAEYLADWLEEVAGGGGWRRWLGRNSPIAPWRVTSRT